MFKLISVPIDVLVDILRSLGDDVREEILERAFLGEGMEIPGPPLWSEAVAASRSLGYGRVVTWSEEEYGGEPLRARIVREEGEG